MRPWQMWTDYPGPRDYAPEPRLHGQGDVRHNGRPDDGAIAHIALPNGHTHPVYPPARGRLGFRREQCR